MARRAIWCAVFSSIRRRAIWPRTRSAKTPPPGTTSRRRRRARSAIRCSNGLSEALRPRLPPTLTSRSQRNEDVLRKRRPLPVGSDCRSFLFKRLPTSLRRSCQEETSTGPVAASGRETEGAGLLRQQYGDRGRRRRNWPAGADEIRDQAGESDDLEAHAARRFLGEEGTDAGGHGPRE